MQEKNPVEKVSVRLVFVLCFAPSYLVLLCVLLVYHPRGGSRRLLLHPSPQRVSVGTLRDHREDCESAGCSSVKFAGRGRGLLKPAGRLSVKLAGCGSLKPAGRCSFKFAGHFKVKFAGRCSLKPASRSDVKPAGRASRQLKVHSHVGSSPRVCVKKPLTRITPCPLKPCP